ncbi:MAG: hypothetical protein ACRC20_12595 [Segniliparus sp.]|uniref:hypothetical protein n=1 Tax=Segniliparus sp. TaxID=2804064 RepID=UPI003F3D4158
MLPGQFLRKKIFVPRKTFCAVAVAAFAAGGVAACGNDGPEGGTKVVYEVVSTTGKPFKVAYVAKTDTDNIADIKKTMATATATSSWKQEAVLSKGTDYALVVVTPDPTNFDTATKYSCKITSGGSTVDEKKDKGGIVVGCAGLKLRDQLKTEGS